VLIPIGHEDQEVRRLPWVTIALVAANVLIFLFTNQLVQQQADVTRQRVQELVRYAAEHPYLRTAPEIRGVIPSSPPRLTPDPDVVAREQTRLDAMWNELRSGASPSVFRQYGYIPAKPSLLALFTSMFLHGGWMHLLGNMLFLWLAGGSLEDRWGRILFLLFYLASGAVSALLHASMNPQSPIPMVGASGAIAGLMGAFLVRLARTRIRFFYWFIIVRGTFAMPAYVALPLWLLQQFGMAKSGAGGGIAVWAHIGGFLFGALVALVIRLADLEKNFLASAVTRKTVWSPSEQLSAALEKLDKGDADGCIRGLVALLRQSPNSIEARAALVAAYTQKGDAASAGRESGRLVSAYIVARDMEGGLAALQEHWRAHPEVPVPLRNLLTLATHQEKQGRNWEAADLYQRGIQAWPDDPLLPKALVAFGRLKLEALTQPVEALALLEQAQDHPRVTPEFQRAAAELIVAARRSQPEAAQAQEPAYEVAEAEPAVAEAREPVVPPATVASAAVEMPAEEPTPPPTVPEAPARSGEPVEPQVAEQGGDASTLEIPADWATPPPPTWKLIPVSMRAVEIETRGLRLQNRDGKSGLLPWQNITGVSAARIGDPAATEQSGDQMVLDLLMAPKSTPDGEMVRSVRLTGRDLAIPQLQSEPSAVRGFQRLVATILKATGATPYPSREDCLGLRGFPAFPDLESYDAALLACLQLAAA
jgi:membrane associated rhomboid family serine protease